MSGREKLLLLFILGVGPILLGLATFGLSFRRAEHVSFCASCHTMTPWVADLENPKSKSLAALHYRNRWILDDQCYTCHVDYDFMGPVRAKLDGVKHVLAYYFGIGMPKTIQLYKPYPNANCLQCHGAAANFNKNPAHVAVMQPLKENKLSCLACHQPIHTPEG